MPISVYIYKVVQYQPLARMMALMAKNIENEIVLPVVRDVPQGHLELKIKTLFQKVKAMIHLFQSNKILRLSRVFIAEQSGQHETPRSLINCMHFNSVSRTSTPLSVTKTAHGDMKKITRCKLKILENV